MIALRARDGTLEVPGREREQAAKAKVWSTLRARAARLGVAAFRAEDAADLVFIVQAGQVRMMQGLEAVEASVAALEAEAAAQAAPQRPGLTWVPRSIRAKDTA